MQQMTNDLSKVVNELKLQKQRASAAEAQVTQLRTEAQSAQEEMNVLKNSQAQTDVYEHVTEAVAKGFNQQQNKRSIAVDKQGIGKPQMFDKESRKYLEWSGELVNYLCAVEGEGFRSLLETVAEYEVAANLSEIDEDHFDNLQNPLGVVSEQIYHLLVHVTKDESYELLTTSDSSIKGNGLEAWRRLARRWDPAVAGRSRQLLRQITAPKKSNMSNALKKIRDWKSSVARYEKRKDNEGKNRLLSDDIRLSAFEALIPKEMEDHLLFHRARLKTYMDCESEVIGILETKQGESIEEDGKDIA